MHLKSIRLQNYRNYETLELDFSEQTNVLIGENAQGKTNLLESIYVLALAKSHRTTQDRELIGWEADAAMVEGRIHKRTGRRSSRSRFHRKGRKRN